ncbi:MAG TPA: HAD family hydrolase [Thermoplasmata archaeon]|nr:HAD family hydrolase [Thermoplasmata archaeon]
MAAPSRIRAVLFDLGGTLVDYHDFAHWTELARRCFVPVEEEALAHAFVEVEKETDVREKPSYEEFWRRTLERAAGREVDAASAARFLGLSRERPGFFRLYSDTRRCLERLSADGRRLGVISNSSSEARCRAILHGTGILPFFERVVSSGTEGVEKPAPAIFHRTLERMRLAPAEALYVGNLAFTDAVAAREAGLHAIWLNRAGTGLGDDPPEITSLLEVPLALHQLEGTAPAPRAAGGRAR